MKLGKQVMELPLSKVCEYIDWSPFFYTWEMPGIFPRILESAKYGEQATKLYQDAQAVLSRWIGDGSIHLRAVFGIWAANAVGDDIVFYTDETRECPAATFFCLRQQKEKELPGEPYLCLADFLFEREDGMDYCGGFAVSSGHEIPAMTAAYKQAGDDYSAILVQSLGDRLAEASAEYVHKMMRDQFGLSAKEGFSVDEPMTPEHLEYLIKKRYDGIRPAIGYPSLPDHSEKATLWALLGAEEATGVKLTESFAMNPQGSTCGLVFFSPESHYFSVGKITREQVEDYAGRKGISHAAAEKWLKHNLE